MDEGTRTDTKASPMLPLPFAPASRRAAFVLALLLPAAGCTTSDPTLGLGDNGLPYAAVGMTGAAGALAASGGPRRSALSIAFLPVVGVPEARAEGLAKALSDAATARGITIAPQGELAPYRLKGSFSTSGSDGALAFVFDVYDAGGTLIDRIDGQEAIAGRAGRDPWDAVDGRVLAAVAKRAMDGFAGSAVARS